MASRSGTPSSRFSPLPGPAHPGIRAIPNRFSAFGLARLWYPGGVMRLSKRAEYALRALAAMARRPAQTVSQIEELSAAEGLPPKVLEQILLVLKKADLLHSKRGVGGGYHLTRPASSISLGEILRAVDGPFLPIGENPADLGPGLRACFSDLTRLVDHHLDGLSLADVLARESGGSMHFDI